MTDTPTTVGLATPAGTLQFQAVTDGLGDYALQTVPRTDGAPVTTGNPLPVADAAAEASLATLVTTVATLATAAVQATMATLLNDIVTNTTGAATSARQDTGNASLASIVTNTTGAATAALQSTANSLIAATNTALGGTLAVKESGVTPTAVSGALTLAAGGTSQTLAGAATATRGILVGNPTSASGQGLGAAESAWVNLTGSAAATTGGGTTIELAPGEKLLLTVGIATAITWNAPTTGHKIYAELLT